MIVILERTKRTIKDQNYFLESYFKRQKNIDKIITESQNIIKTNEKNLKTIQI